MTRGSTCARRSRSATAPSRRLRSGCRRCRRSTSGKAKACSRPSASATRPSRRSRRSSAPCSRSCSPCSRRSYSSGTTCVSSPRRARCSRRRSPSRTSSRRCRRPFPLPPRASSSARWPTSTSETPPTTGRPSQPCCRTRGARWRRSSRTTRAGCGARSMSTSCSSPRASCGISKTTGRREARRPRRGARMPWSATRGTTAGRWTTFATGHSRALPG